MILVTGAAGQLGSGLMRFFTEKGIKAIGVDRPDFDITNREDTIQNIAMLNPEIVFHCAAYSDVELAEKESDICEIVNVKGTENIILACKKVSAKLVYISTDYVFDGMSDVPYEITDEVHPLNIYGKTKAIGEKLVGNYDKSFVVRISWLFGKNGKNFVNTMLRLGKEKNSLTVVVDQVGSPTYVADLVPILYDISISEKYGIYHITNEGFCSWAEFAEKIMKYSGLNCQIKPVTSDVYGATAKRPKNSRLNKDCLDERGLQRLPLWEDALKRYLSDCLKGEK